MAAANLRLQPCGDRAGAMVSLDYPQAKATAVNTPKDKIRAAAQKYLQKGQIDKAIREFERLVQEDPGDVRTLLKIGELQARLGNTAQATETYSDVAEHYASQGFSLKAIAVYKQVLALDASQLDIGGKLAETYVQLGLISDAISQYRLLCSQCEAIGLWDACIAAAKRLVVLDKAQVAAKIKLAEVQARAGHVAEAIKGFDEAAAELEEQGRLDEWAKVVERVVQLAPLDSHRCRLLAAFYLKHADPRRALAKLQMAFQIDAQQPETLQLLATAFEALEQPVQALSALRELAQCQQKGQDHSGWRNTLQHILRLAPEDAQARAHVQAQGPSRKVVGEPPKGPSVGPSGTMQGPSELDAQAITLIEPFSQDEVILTGELVAADPAPAGSAADGRQEDVATLLSEVDTYLKYNLRDQARAQLDRILFKQPQHRGAQSRYVHILQDAGDISGAVARLFAMASQAAADGEVALAQQDLAQLLQCKADHVAALELARHLQPSIAAPAQLEPAEPVEVEVELEVAPQPTPPDYAPSEAGDFTDSITQIDHPLAADATVSTGLGSALQDFAAPFSASELDLNAAFDNIFAEFAADAAPAADAGADAGVQGQDVATHFDLGIAYKEMGMLTEAIAAFEQTTSVPQYEVNACTMLGLCHLEMGRMDAALAAFRRGLNAPQITPQQATALRYEVGLAYESMGQIADALKFYQKTHAMDPRFRDVAARLAEAQAGVKDSTEVSSSELDALLEDAAGSGRDAVKVSFL